MSEIRSDPPRDPDGDLTDDRWCFVCGVENPFGLQTRWSLDEDGTARARFEPGRRHQGWRGVVHGGILAALCDEAMAQRIRLAGRTGAVTADLSIRYRKPVPTSGAFLVEAVVEAEDRRMIRLRAVIRGEDGTPHVEATGICLRPRGRGERSVPGAA